MLNNRPPFSFFISIVVSIHLLLLVVSYSWNPTQLNSQPAKKMIVQTIKLHPLQAQIAQSGNFIPSSQSSPPSSPLEPIKKEAIEKEIVEAPKVIPMEKTPPIPSPTVKKEPAAEKNNKPAPVANEKPEKQPVPVKKVAEPSKSPPKKQPEKENKQLEEKKQRERMEAEKKREQEIAAAQEAARKKELALLAKAKENLAKMNENREKIASSTTPKLNTTPLPKELDSLHVDALAMGENSESWGTKEASYADEVAYRLKMALKLPDYGAVKVKLTISRTGKVIKVETMQSESKKNTSYIETKIPNLLFPAFGLKFQGVEQNTFVITLQND